MTPGYFGDAGGPVQGLNDQDAVNRAARNLANNIGVASQGMDWGLGNSPVAGKPGQSWDPRLMRWVDVVQVNGPIGGEPGQVWDGSKWVNPNLDAMINRVMQGEKAIPESPEKKVDTTNPKDVIGSTKLPLDLWPMTATIMGSLGLMDGMMKYGRTNWRATDVRASIYVAACQRHLGAWFEGEDVDPDSKLPHLAHALACLAILVDADASGTLIDDRQLKIKYREYVEKMTPLVNIIKANHAERVPPKHFTIKDSK